ncbi:unnamed protein product [Alopecurus aequalis]
MDAIALVVFSFLAGTSRGKKLARDDDNNFHQERVNEGGCLEEFITATMECHPHEIRKRPDYADRVVNVEECVNATAALRKCFAGNPEMFRHLYLPRIDHGLDEDLKPSREQVMEERSFSYRWWTGMRRS